MGGVGGWCRVRVSHGLRPDGAPPMSPACRRCFCGVSEFLFSFKSGKTGHASDTRIGAYRSDTHIRYVPCGDAFVFAVLVLCTALVKGSAKVFYLSIDFITRINEFWYYCSSSDNVGGLVCSRWYL